MLAFKAYLVVYDADGSTVDTSHDCIKDMIKALNSIQYDATDSEKISTISKLINMVHSRGKIAAAFVEGGIDTCNYVSNMSTNEIKESKDVDYINYIAQMFKHLM